MLVREEQDRALGRGDHCSAWEGAQQRILPLQTSPLHSFWAPFPTPTGRRTGAHLPQSPPACSCIRALWLSQRPGQFPSSHLHLLGTIWLHLQAGLPPTKRKAGEEAVMALFPA